MILQWTRTFYDLLDDADVEIRQSVAKAIKVNKRLLIGAAAAVDGENRGIQGKRLICTYQLRGHRFLYPRVHVKSDFLKIPKNLRGKLNF